MTAKPDYMKFFRSRAEATRYRPHHVRMNQMALAMREYEDARLVRPISRATFESCGDPGQCPTIRPAEFYREILARIDAGQDMREAFNMSLLLSGLTFIALKP